MKQCIHVGDEGNVAVLVNVNGPDLANLPSAEVYLGMIARSGSNRCRSHGTNRAHPGEGLSALLQLDCAPTSNQRVILPNGFSLWMRPIKINAVESKRCHFFERCLRTGTHPIRYDWNLLQELRRGQQDGTGVSEVGPFRRGNLR